MLGGENRITTTDSLFFKKEMFDSAKTGLQHNIPISTNFKLFKFFSFSASTNFQETWVFKTVNKSYDQENQQEIIDETSGFDSFRTYNFSTSLGTTIYGMYNFSEKSKIKALRHVLRPSLSFGISPPFNQYYDSYEVVSADGLTTSEVEYSRFEGSIFGLPNKNYSSSLSFSLNNNIEAKVIDKESDEDELKKIKIFNNLNFSTSYNLALDSLNLSPIRMTGGTQLLKNKLNLNFGATFDAYALDENNRRINKFNINNGGGLFRVTSANLTFNYSLNSDNNKKESKKEESMIDESLRNGGRDDDLFGIAMDTASQAFNLQDEKKRK